MGSSTVEEAFMHAEALPAAPLLPSGEQGEISLEDQEAVVVSLWTAAACAHATWADVARGTLVGPQPLPHRPVSTGSDLRADA